MQQKTPVMVFAVVYTVAFIVGFNENLMNMALMSIMRDYAIDSVTAQWLVTGYMIMATLVVVCMAYLSRRIPLRPLFFAASALTLAGSLMSLIAPNFVVLLAARLIQAAGRGKRRCGGGKRVRRGCSGRIRHRAHRRHHVILLFPAAARKATRSPQRLLNRDCLIQATRPASRRVPRRC